MTMGSSLWRSSRDAISIGSLSPTSSTGRRGGAPSESCSALAPMILAFSYFVSQGGPILMINLVDMIDRGREKEYLKL